MRKKGSYTIEATFIMIFITAVLVFIIYLAFYVHDRTIFVKCAYIAALRASQTETIGEKSIEQTARENAELLPKGKLLGKWELQVQTWVVKEEVYVRYVGKMQLPKGLLTDQFLQEYSWKFSAEEEARIINEVLYIRESRR